MFSQMTELANLEPGSVFTISERLKGFDLTDSNTARFKKGYEENGKVLCEPFLGGRFQPKMAKWFPTKLLVSVNSDEKGED